MSRDGWTTVASLLRSEEAELLRGLLESAGIEALVDDAQLSALNPLLQSAVGGAKVLVPAAEAARALAIVSESGLFAGTPGEAVEIPEEEWSAPPAPDGAAPADAPPEAAASGADVSSAPGERAASHALRASFVAFALAWTLVLPLYALVASLRARRATAAPTPRARTRRGWALAVSALALAVGVAAWLTVFPAIQRLQADGGAPPPAERAPAPARF